METENSLIQDDTVQSVMTKNVIKASATSKISSSLVDIENWLAFYLADKLGLDFEEIELDESFSYYGLDSAMAVRLIGDLGVALNRKLSPTLLYSYTTISSLAQYLSE